jgi:pullulanase
MSGFPLAACASRLCGALLCCAATSTAAAELAACTAASPMQTLHAAAMPAPAARAVWIDATRVHWAGAAPDGRFVLYHDGAARVVARAGEVVGGAAGSIPLVVQRTPLDKALRESFAWLGDGTILAVPAKHREALDAIWRGQALIAQVDADGRVLALTATQLGAALDARYAAAAGSATLGALVDGDRTRFALWAPTAQAVAVCTYASGQGEAIGVTAMQRDDGSGIWRAEAAMASGYYTYLVDVYVAGVGVVRNRVTDPYSLSLTTDSQRSWIGSLDHPATQPEGWAEGVRPQRVTDATDMVIYELHVRDFSINDASVPESRRGRYVAFTESNTHGVRHLRALSDAGVTDLHLLPAYDLASIPESGCVTPRIPDAAPNSEQQQAAVVAVRAIDCFNWGYDPWHYTAPEGSYASDPADGAIRVREFRAMVDALHRIGLRVGMDVVYNHTSHSGQHAKSVLDRIVPGYYHRLNAQGEIERSTCCENTATERRMMAKLMIDSAVVWARDYRIDSFRFDLMGHQPRSAMLDLQRAVDAAAGRRVQLIGEGWNFGEVANGARFMQASQLSLNGSGIGTFSDRARDAVRGGGPADNDIRQLQRQGYVNGLVYARNPHAPQLGLNALRAAADMVRVGLAGSLRDYRMTAHTGDDVALSAIDYNGQPAGYVTQPHEVVNYVENHDNQTLFDVNVFKLPPQTSREDRARVQVLALAINAFSQGIAYFHAGGELLRSKSMDRNSFDSGDWFNRIDWTARDSHFGTGLPPRDDNAASWPLMRPLLADPGIKPTPAHIVWTRDAFLDLLRIRAGSTLFRLRDAEQIGQRLRFANTGPQQVPTVLVGHLDGQGLGGAAFRELIYMVNVEPVAREIVLADQRNKRWTLHPIHRDGADRRPADSARFDAATGRFEVPPRTAMVWIIAPDGD